MQIKLANYIANFFAAQNIRDVFTITGGGAMHLNDAFGHHNDLHCTYNHHEQACAIAAEAYARLTGNLALVCVTSGPGGTNAITGVMGGWLDSIPMFVVSGQVKFSTTIRSTDVPLRQLGDQEFNIVDCVACMTKYAVMVTDPNSISYHLERALFLATHGRPGPVWLDIPLNVQGAMIDTDALQHYDPAEDAAILPPEPEEKAIQQMLQRITQAKRPVILAGGGIRTGKAHDLFFQVIERLNIPVVTAWNAHDVLWDDHPLSCGRPGTVGTRGGNFIVQNSDLLISFACRMNIRQISYEWANFANQAYKIAVDIDAGELQKPTLSIDLPIHADIKAVFEQILATGYMNPSARHASWLNWCRAIDRRYPAVLASFEKDQPPLNPYVFLRALSEEYNEGEVTVTGNGSACVCSFQAMRILPKQRLFTNSGCASMGYGLPAALGAAVAQRGKRVICLDGDGSIQMNLQELQTIVHNRLNIKIFWLNNNGYHSIRQTQTNVFHANFCGVDGDSGVSFPSAERIAAAYQIPFVRAENPETLQADLRRALETQGPVICEAVLSPTQPFEPKLSSRVLPDGRIVSPPIDDMFPFLEREEYEKNKNVDLI